MIYLIYDICWHKKNQMAHLMGLVWVCFGVCNGAKQWAEFIVDMPINTRFLLHWDSTLFLIGGVVDLKINYWRIVSELAHTYIKLTEDQATN